MTARWVDIEGGDDIGFLVGAEEDVFVLEDEDVTRDVAVRGEVREERGGRGGVGFLEECDLAGFRCADADVNEVFVEFDRAVPLVVVSCRL